MAEHPGPLGLSTHINDSEFDETPGRARTFEWRVPLPATAMAVASGSMMDRRRVAALLVSGVSCAGGGGHQREIGNRQNPDGTRLAFGARRLLISLLHRTELRKRTARGASVFVEGHAIAEIPVFCQSALAKSALPGTDLDGPFAFGRMSNAKISEGTYSVAHAFGISTMPLMWPSTGAVPRMA